MDRLLIADGSNLLFQMFYGMPSRIVNSQGRPIHGTLGFVGALLRVIRETEPTHVAVLFDGEHDNTRTQIDPAYKADREDFTDIPEEQTPFCQLPDIYRALNWLGICHRETQCCEADDWIAGYARQYADRAQVIILSQDSDFFQLISETVTVYRYRGQKSVNCDRQWLWEKWGIDPSVYPDFKAMTGDPSDNIPGIPGIGPKTAAALLQQFGSLQGILQQLPAVQRPALRKTLEENRQRLQINDKLIRLTGDGELPFNLQQMAYQYQGQTTGQVLQAIGLR